MKKVAALVLILAFCLTPAAMAAGTLNLPKDLEIIETEAFMNVGDADKLIVHEGTTEIQSCAFANSTIVTANLPDSVTYIADDAFSGSRLRTINASEGSYAYNWASSHGFEAVDPDAPAVQPPTEFGTVTITGDANILYAGETITWTVNTASTAKKSYRICGNSSSNVITSGSFTGNTLSFTPEKAMTYWIDLSYVEGVTKYMGSAYIRAVDPVENAAPASDFTYTIKGGNAHVSITAYNGTQTDVIVPPIIDGCPVEVVCLQGNAAVQSVVLPVVTGYITDNAFAGCTALHTVEVTAGSADSLANDTDYIGNDAFRGCTSLVNFKIPESVLRIGAFAFDGCTALTEIVIPENVTEIANYAFRGCTNLQTARVPASVTEIGPYNFQNCPNLTLLVEKGSVAETYAVENGVPYAYFS